LGDGHVRHLLKLVGMIAAMAVAVVLGTAASAEAAVRDRPAVDWGGRTHSTRESLEVWLAERGLDYDAWAYQHPIAAFRLDQAADRAERVTTAPARRAAPPAARGLSVSPALLAIVVALGLVLAALAFVLSSASIRFNPSLRFASDRRGYIAFTGAACVTVAAASYAVQF
jgi:hypothetical protein